MNRLREILNQYLDGVVLNTLNLGGTILVAIGIVLLPIHISYRLILLGAAFLLAWYSYER